MAYKNPAAHADYMRLRYKDDAEFRQRHKLLVSDRKQRVKEEIRLVIAEIKKQGCCLCSECTQCCLSFHHKDESKKSFAICQAAHIGVSIKTLLLEIEKCVLLCENCHRKVHAGLITVLSQGLSYAALRGLISHCLPG